MQDIDFSDYVYIDETSPTGLRWKVRTSNRIKVGAPAGTFGGTGYYSVSICGIKTTCHRVVWQIYNGAKIPSGMEIDHIDCNKTNNSPSNLRLANYSENGMNKGLNKNNTSGTKGVCLDRRCGKWRAYIMINRKQVSLGYYSRKEDAETAAADARNKIHKEFARH